MSTTENKPFSVVPMLDGRVVLIERIVGKDDRAAIRTAVFFESEQAAEAWRKDRRAGKAEECPLPRETGALTRPQARTHRAPFAASLALANDD